MVAAMARTGPIIGEEHFGGTSSQSLFSAPSIHGAPMPPEQSEEEEHEEWCQTMWARMDRNGDETISTQELDCEEFRNIIRGVLAPKTNMTTGGSLYTRVEMNMNQAINFCMRKADLNENASLSFTEFKAFMRYLRETHQRKHTADMIFSLFDLDGTNTIDESEFREIYRFYLGHIPREDEFQKEWARVDVRGDQKVTRAGYILWLQTSTNPVFKQHAPPQSSATPQTSSAAEKLPGLTRSSRDIKVRPKWNQRFNAGANMNMEAPKGQRSYFSRPQSLPELARYYECHRGFKQASRRLALPEEPKKTTVLSTDTGVEMMPSRSVPAGSMRDCRTGKVQRWKDYWQTPACIRTQYQPGTLDLRCPGPPPKQSVHVDDF